MAEITRPKRRRCIPRYKPDFYQDLVESLELDIPDEELSSVVELVQSKTSGINDHATVSSTIASLLKREHLVSDDVNLVPRITQALKKLSEPGDEEDQSHLNNVEQELIKKYRDTGKLAPSEATWKVLVFLGLVKDFHIFAAEAKRNMRKCRHDKVDMEAIRPTLDGLADAAVINESNLFVTCTVVLAHCVRFLNTTVSKNFSYRCNFGDCDMQGRMDLSIIYAKQLDSPLISVVIEINNDVLMDLSMLSKDILAHLFYKGYKIYRKQHVMPLLILTDCYIWHCLKMDVSAGPSSIVEYSFAECGCLGTASVDSASQLPLTDHSYFDPTPVLSEIIAFNKELVHKQQQASN